MKPNSIPAPSSSARSLTRRGWLRLLGIAASALACNLPTRRSVAPIVTASALPPSPTPIPPSSLAPEVITPSPAPSTAAAPTPVPALFLIDAHEDITWNWLEFGRDPRESAFTIRAQERGGSVESFIGQRTTGLPEWLAGRVGIIFSTLFTMPQHRAWSSSMTQVYVNTQQAHDLAIDQLAAYEQLADTDPSVCLITTRDTLDAVAASWMDSTTPAPCVGLVIAMEGADPIRQPTEVADWYARGLRIIMPAWAQTQYAGGNGEPGPLSESGRQLLDEMSRLNMILDLSHISDQSFFEAADRYSGPLIVSHSNPRAFLPTDRGLTDDMIRTIAARDGVIGVIPYNRYLQPGWQTGNARIPVQTFLDAIDYIAQLVGVEHVAIGSDFDGGFGVESVPAGIDTVSDLLPVTHLLSNRGYSDDQIAAVAYSNWLRILRTSFT